MSLFDIDSGWKNDLKDKLGFDGLEKENFKNTI